METFFDGQPFGFSFAGPMRVGNAPGAYGPPDPVEVNELETCRCGMEFPRGSYWASHGYEPCPAFTQARRSA